MVVADGGPKMGIGSMRATPNGDGQGPVGISPDVGQVVAELAIRFPGVPPEALQRVVTEEFGVFDGAAISTFVPVLVAKAATARLTRTAPS
jgi:hypothetical protein